MSKGSFTNVVYRSGKATDNLHPIRVQPETLALVIGTVTNTAPVGPATSEMRAVVSTRRRRGAVNVRKVGLEIVDDPRGEYEEGSIVYVPWLNPATFDGVLSPPNQTGIYDGATVRVVGSSYERIIY